MCVSHDMKWLFNTPTPKPVEIHNKFSICRSVFHAYIGKKFTVQILCYKENGDHECDKPNFAYNPILLDVFVAVLL